MIVDVVAGAPQFASKAFVLGFDPIDELFERAAGFLNVRSSFVCG